MSYMRCILIISTLSHSPQIHLCLYAFNFVSAFDFLFICLFFNTWSTASAGHILLNCSLPLEHGWPTRSLALKENGFSLSLQLPVASSSLYRVGFQALIPSPCWDLVWLELVRFLDTRLSCCEFMCAVALLCPRTLCPCVSHCCWLMESFRSLCYNDSQTLGGGRWIDVHFRSEHSSLLFSALDTLWICINHHLLQEESSWELRNALIYEYRSQFNTILICQ